MLDLSLTLLLQELPTAMLVFIRGRPTEGFPVLN